MHRLAHSFIARFAASITDRWFDQHLQTAILEGVANVPPHTWTRDTHGGLNKALNHLNLQDSDWGGNSGLYGALVRAAKAILGPSGLHDSAEDLVQRVISGDTLPGTPGGEPYLVGRQIAPQVEAGEQGGGIGAARALLLRHLKQRALNEIRGSNRERTRIGPGVQEGIESDDGRVEQYPGSTMYSPEAGDVALESLLSGPGADRAKAWLVDLWSERLRPSDLNIVRAWLADPNKNYQQLGRELGVSGSFIGKAMTRAVEIARTALETNPPDFVRQLQMRELAAPLNIGVRSRLAAVQAHTTLNAILHRMAQAR